MHHKFLNIHSHQLTSYFLHNAFQLQNCNLVEEYLIIPKGTVGINVILEGECVYVYEKHQLKLPPVWVFGLITKPLQSQISANYKSVGFRFKPEFFSLLLNGKIPELKNQVLSLNDLFLKNETDWLMDHLLVCKNEFSIMETFNTFLQNKFSNHKIDKRVEYSLSKIRQGEVNNMESLSKDLNISTTRLRTLFYNQVGMAPKEFVKVYRMQRALHAGHLSEENLTQLSYQLGYYDQSHFIHEFKEAIGISPLKYFSNKMLTYDFYNFDRWRVSSFAK